MKLLTFSCTLATCILASSVYAAYPSAPDTKTVDNAQLETVIAIMQQREVARDALDFAMAQIKSENDLQNYLQTQGFSQSPLDALSPPARQRFLTSLQFNERGLTSFEYRDLEEELSASQIYRILSLFGAQHDAAIMKHARVVSPVDQQILDSSFHTNGFGGLGGFGGIGDHSDYKCDRLNPHTCTSDINSICTSNC
jgi:hypothetical protein